MSVNSYHPEYALNMCKWDRIQAVIDNDAQDYLRTIDPADTSRDNCLRNQQYKESAVLVNFTALTQQGLAGLVFRKPPKVKLPKQIDYIKETATVDDRSLITFSRDVIIEIITKGRAGILVDFPRSDSDLDTMDNDLTARMTLYKAEEIINWTQSRVNGKLQLTQVVLRECVQKNGADGFSWEIVTQYRVLRLVKLDGSWVYQQKLYLQNSIEETFPRDFSGNLWNEIPFTFVGADDNTPNVGKSPLYDIAILNIAHYQNSADLEESGHVVGQPTAIMKTNYDLQQFQEANPEGVRLGCRAVYNLGAEGDAKFLQVNPNQMVEMMMRHKEVQAAFIGARLISPAGGRETAEAARMRFGSSNSQLAHLTYNTDEAIKKCLAWICKFQGVAFVGVVFKLNDRFFDEGVDPQVLMQAIMLVQEKIIPRRVVQDYIREAGMVDDLTSNDELDKEIEDEMDLLELLEPASLMQNKNNNAPIADDAEEQ